MTTRYFLNDNLSSDNESRQIKQSAKIIRFLAKSDVPVSLPVIANHIKLSVPTITKLINDLMEQDLVMEEGKKETDNGRKPSVYSLKKNRFYTVGVEVLLRRIQVNITDLNLNTLFVSENSAFQLENSEACRDEVLAFINNAIHESGIVTNDIIGVGLGITGRVNGVTGRSYNFFGFDDLPFADFLAKALDLPVYIENDTRVIGVAELVIGKVKNINNTIIVNISRGIGMTIIVNKKMVTGGNGFAGEFGHMQFVGNEGRLCICGKKGCLDTEVSGKALELMFTESMAAGEQSLMLPADRGNIRYDDIISAANDGDYLPMTLLQQQGVKLGAALGNIINLLNPEMIVIAGKYSRAGSFFRDSIRSGLYKTGLKDPLANCQIISSELVQNTGAIGAAAIVLRKYDLI
ncbi:MAG: ROK family protein [Breznakibacter sp.]